MTRSARRTLALLLACGVFALDRWTKWMIETQLAEDSTRTVIAGFFNLVRSQNPGIAFSLFSEGSSPSHTLILISFSLLALVLLGGTLWRIDRLDNPSAAGLACIFGGATGNVFDRVRSGAVTDFLDFYAGSYHWYTFNLADAAICTGAGLLILSMLLAPRQAAHETAHQKGARA